MIYFIYIYEIYIYFRIMKYWILWSLYCISSYQGDLIEKVPKPIHIFAFIEHGRNSKSWSAFPTKKKAYMALLIIIIIIIIIPFLNPKAGMQNNSWSPKYLAPFPRMTKLEADMHSTKVLIQGTHLTPHFYIRSTELYSWKSWNFSGSAFSFSNWNDEGSPKPTQ